jgi:hypothetical protein
MGTDAEGAKVMRMSLYEIQNTQLLRLELFDGYHICYRKIISGRIGWCVLGHLQEIWMTADSLSLSQIKGFVRLEKCRKIRFKVR